MHRLVTFLLVPTCLAFLSLSALAAQVEGLQLPAWVERAGERLPARAGMALAESDVVETGKGGRLLIQLMDGSFVRLGEEARLALTSLHEGETEQGALTGLFNVVKGAFRYTAAGLGRMIRRDIQVNVASTTIGIRGTDVWGRSKDGGSTVCLIEGKVTLKHPARGEFVMDQPLSFFVAPPEGEPKPVGPVDPEKLKQWAAETDLDLGRGVLLPGGGWIVQLGAHDKETTARKVEKRLLAEGIPVEFTTVQLKSRTYHRLRVSGFDTQEDAKYFAAKLKGRPGIPQTWVTCNIPGSSCK